MIAPPVAPQIPEEEHGATVPVDIALSRTCVLAGYSHSSCHGANAERCRYIVPEGTPSSSSGLRMPPPFAMSRRLVTLWSFTRGHPAATQLCYPLYIG